jgi:hypothetical protein
MSLWRWSCDIAQRAINIFKLFSYHITSSIGKRMNGRITDCERETCLTLNRILCLFSGINVRFEQIGHVSKWVVSLARSLYIHG